MHAGAVSQVSTPGRWGSFGRLLLGATAVVYATDRIAIRHTHQVTPNLGIAIALVALGARDAWKGARAYHAPSRLW